MDAARPPTNVRVVPDLGDELLIVIDRLEALLGSMAVWEIEDDVGLPAPFADGKALRALQTVAGVVRPTQGRGEPQLVQRQPAAGSASLAVIRDLAIACAVRACLAPSLPNRGQAVRHRP